MFCDDIEDEEGMRARTCQVSACRCNCTALVSKPHDVPKILDAFNLILAEILHEHTSCRIFQYLQALIRLGLLCPQEILDLLIVYL